MDRETGSKRSELPIACNLTAPEQARRRQEVAEDIFGGARWVEELEDGYAFSYPGSAEWARKLTEFVAFERACCPFFAFEIIFEPDLGPILLKVRGPESVKEFIETELAALRSG